MPNDLTDEMARKAKQLYKERFQEQLEATHRDEFVAVEPESGDYFLAKTSLEAGLAARQAHPDRLALVMRVGHRAAVYIGAGE
ncbi:MAG: hypothetical protein HZA46_18905 [Planctomycetales bacterium]|nr:hypothetical protein [Planctomycetales bacterium]